MKDLFELLDWIKGDWIRIRTDPDCPKGYVYAFTPKGLHMVRNDPYAIYQPFTVNTDDDEEWPPRAIVMTPGHSDSGEAEEEPTEAFSGQFCTCKTPEPHNVEMIFSNIICCKKCRMEIKCVK